MILRCCLLLLTMDCVRTEYYYDYGLKNSDTELDKTYSFWPSVHNAARLMGLRKREILRRDLQSQPTVSIEGQTLKLPPSNDTHLPVPAVVPPMKDKELDDIQAKTEKEAGNVSAPVNTTKEAVNNNANETVTAPVAQSNATKTPDKVTTQLDINNPGVLKRGVIVFGGFLLLAVAYYIFYRRKGTKNETSNNNPSDVNQFRYGVLQSEDRRDNLELAQPLTMESDDEEDEDLEIFDLEQKKKSLSYVNLQTNDEDVVFNRAQDDQDDKDNLLLDIEDVDTDTLINWTKNDGGAREFQEGPQGV